MPFQTVHDILVSISILTLVVLLMVFLLRRLNQPYLIAYILAGVLLGPVVSGVIKNADDIRNLGQIGILLHMFFMGTEVESPDPGSMLIKPIIAQLIKIFLSALTAVLIGVWMNWSAGSIFILIVILIFNSTAVVSEYLKKTGEFHSALGKITLNILLLQDLMFAPILVSFQFLGKGPVNYFRVISAIVACVLVFIFFKAIRKKKEINIPYTKGLENDHDLQIFIGLFICFGFALLAYYFGLTESFGGFVAGVLIAKTNTFNWLEKALKPFKVFFMCLFFLSIGLMLDIRYLIDNYQVILAVTFSIMIINSLLSTIVFRSLRHNWRNSIYAGALLSQIGEYSLLASSLAYQMNIIELNFYQNVLIVTCLSLLFSTIWITILRAFIYEEKSSTRNIYQRVSKCVSRRDSTQHK